MLLYKQIKNVKKIFLIILVVCGFNAGMFNYVSADSVKLLEDPNEAWQARIDLIEQAENTIEVEYYTIAPDKAGKIFVGLLKEAADRGVKVKILVGGLTHATIDKDSIAMLVQHPNIEIRFYNSIKEWYRPSHWLKHLHDKILLVDNKYLITGGRNIADKYFDMTPPEKQQTIDRDILIVGDTEKENIPAQVLVYFNDLWESKNVEITPAEMRLNDPCFRTFRGFFLFGDFFSCTKRSQKFQEKIDAKSLALADFLTQEKTENPQQFGTQNNWITQAKPVNSIKFAHDPTDVKKTANNGTALALAQEMQKAKKSILYFTPYIVKTKEFLNTAEIAKKNKVQQIVLTNSAYSGANLFGIAGTELDYRDFAKLGLTYWAYQGFHSMHHKTYIIDDHITISSTFNYDPRSQNLNTEMLYIIDDLAFTEEVKKANQVFFDQALQLDKWGNAIETDELKAENISFIHGLILFIIKLIFPLIRWAI
jgi:putative cardiolipin synthase